MNDKATSATYPDYQIANIRLLAESIAALDDYSGRGADMLIGECDDYEPGTGSAFDGLMVTGAARVVLTDMDNTGIGNHVMALQLAEQIAPSV